jgi:hypothetical protein
MLTALLVSCASGARHAPHAPERSSHEPPPDRLHFTYGSLSIVKEGNQIHALELRTLYSTMPMPKGTPPESSVLGKQRLETEVFADIWDRLRAFDFTPYVDLEPNDFRIVQDPDDAAFSASLSLHIDGHTVIDINLQSGPLKDAALQAGLDELYESIDRILRTAGARQGLAHVATPQNLVLAFGRTRFVKGPEGTYIYQYYLFPPESEVLAQQLPRLQPLAEAHPDRLQVTQSTLQVTIDEGDFIELWRELKAVDIARFSRLQRSDFLFRPQRVTYEFFLVVDSRQLIHLMYTDREIAPNVAAPMVRIEQLLDAKAWQKIQQLERTGSRPTHHKLAGNAAASARVVRLRAALACPAWCRQRSSPGRSSAMSRHAGQTRRRQ